MWHWRSKRNAAPTEEAVEALRQAEYILRDAHRRDFAASDVARRLNETTARNHFRLAVEHAMRRKNEGT